MTRICWGIVGVAMAMAASCPTVGWAGESSPLQKRGRSIREPAGERIHRALRSGRGADASQRVFNRHAEPIVGQRWSS
jgi:hypothetical protein